MAVAALLLRPGMKSSEHAMKSSHHGMKSTLHTTLEIYDGMAQDKRLRLRIGGIQPFES